MSEVYDFLLRNSIIIILLLFLLIFLFIYKTLEFFGKNPDNILPFNIAKRMRWPLLLLLISIALRSASLNFINEIKVVKIIHQIAVIGIISAITWIIINVLKIIKKRILKKYDISKADNLRARKIQTQYVILENTIIFIVLVLAVGIALMTFRSIRNVGISILTSAGIAGIIVGFAAQRVLGTIMAGIQIAITQPIRFDDVVIIEEEWGRIEEITLTYVVVNLWDKRRLVVPSTYFLENVFQNWTRTQADILGTVFLYTDYSVPLKPLRKELTRLLKSSPLWDGEVNLIQVTETSEKTIELRALMSARNSGEAFDLRAFVREGLIDFLQNNFPNSLPKLKIEH